MVVIGISPKSFGFYYFNNKEKQGLEMLQNHPTPFIYDKITQYILPGTNMNTSWLLAMESVKQNLANEFAFKVNYKKYRLLQILHNLNSYASQDGVEFKDLIKVAKSLFWWEGIFYSIPFLMSFALRPYPRKTFVKKITHKIVFSLSHSSHGQTTFLPGKYENILQVFQQNPVNSAE
jgi:hypothetical protein